MNIKNAAYILISLIALVVVLSFGKSLIIPLVFAAILWFIVKQIRNLLNKIPFVAKHFPIWLKNLLSIALIVFLLDLALGVIISNVNLLSNSYMKYEGNLYVLIEKVNETFNIDIISKLRLYYSDLDFGTFILSALKISTDILSSTFMIIIYALFIFLEESSFKLKLKRLISENTKFEDVYEIIENIENSVSNYLGLKILMSLLTGVLSYFILLIIGIDFPAFWAFMIFLLNFIPTIGSLMATLFPFLFGILQFGEIMPPLSVLIFVGAVQVIVGNFLEPKLMGNSMNISPLVTILALSFWGALWGITGMILSVPITVIIIIVLSKFPQTRPIAIMLSDKGDIG